MKALVFGLAALALLGCKEREGKKYPGPTPSLTQSADGFREDLIAFSKDAAGIPREGQVDSVVKGKVIPLPVKTAPHHVARKTLVPKPLSKDSSLVGDTLPYSRPFSAGEVSRYVEEHYRAAFAQLLTSDPRFDRTVEEGQVYSQDGAFSLLRARRALSIGHFEEALVQAELAAKRGSQLDPDTKKSASRIRCETLDSIRRLRPSEEARAAASKAWLSYNLTYSSN